LGLLFKTESKQLYIKLVLSAAILYKYIKLLIYKIFLLTILPQVHDW